MLQGEDGGVAGGEDRWREEGRKGHNTDTRTSEKQWNQRTGRACSEGLTGCTKPLVFIYFLFQQEVAIFGESVKFSLWQILYQTLSVRCILRRMIKGANKKQRRGRMKDQSRKWLQTKQELIPAELWASTFWGFCRLKEVFLVHCGSMLVCNLNNCSDNYGLELITLPLSVLPVNCLCTKGFLCQQHFVAYQSEIGHWIWIFGHK